MELGQQQKFEVEYTFADERPERIVIDYDKEKTLVETSDSTDANMEGNRDEIDEDKDLNGCGDVKHENGTEENKNGDEAKKKDFGFWNRKKQGTDEEGNDNKRKHNFSCTASMRGETFSGTGTSTLQFLSFLFSFLLCSYSSILADPRHRVLQGPC